MEFPHTITKLALDPEGDVILQLDERFSDISQGPAETTENHERLQKDGCAAADSLLTPPADEEDEEDEEDGDADCFFASKGREKRSHGRVELLVSSSILCETSPVFRALLRGSFVEADNFATHQARENRKTAETAETAEAALSSPLPPTKPHPYRLKLQYDDAEAMTLLVRLAHAQLDVSVGLPTPDLLERLAVVADKYLCAAVLRWRGVAGVWLATRQRILERELGGVEKKEKTEKTEKTKTEKTKTEKTKTEKTKTKTKTEKKSDLSDPSPLADLCSLLVFAYVADQPRAFSALCSQLCTYHPGPLTAAAAPASVLADHALLSHDLATILEGHRQELEVQQKLEEQQEQQRQERQQDGGEDKLVCQERSRAARTRAATTMTAACLDCLRSDGASREKGTCRTLHK